MTSKVRREWWIYQGENKAQFEAAPIVVWGPKIDDYVKVIPADDAIPLEDVRELIETLEFYTNKLNWYAAKAESNKNSNISLYDV